MVPRMLLQGVIEAELRRRVERDHALLDVGVVHGLRHAPALGAREDEERLGEARPRELVGVVDLLDGGAEEFEEVVHGDVRGDAAPQNEPGLFIWTNHDSTGRGVSFQPVCPPP